MSDDNQNKQTEDENKQPETNGDKVQEGQPRNMTVEDLLRLHRSLPGGLPSKQ